MQVYYQKITQGNAYGMCIDRAWIDRELCSGCTDWGCGDEHSDETNVYASRESADYDRN